MSRVETVAGTLIAISASIPGTFNAAGYAALPWTNVAEITDAGEHGREYNLVTHMPISSRGVQKFKGSFNEGSKALKLAMDQDDAGQVIVKAALVSDNDYSFRVTYQGSDIDYFQAKVMTFKKNASSVDAIRAASVTLEITTSTTGVGVVEVIV